MNEDLAVNIALMGSLLIALAVVAIFISPAVGAVIGLIGCVSAVVGIISYYFLVD